VLINILPRNQSYISNLIYVKFDGFVKSPISVLRLALTVAPIGLKHRTACHSSSVPCTTVHRQPIGVRRYLHTTSATAGTELLGICNACWSEAEIPQQAGNLNFFLCHKSFDFLRIDQVWALYFVKFCLKKTSMSISFRMPSLVREKSYLTGS